MNVKTYLFNRNNWNELPDSKLDSEQTLVTVFGSADLSTMQKGLDDLIAAYPTSIIVGCSTSGEIYGSELFDNTLSVSVVRFEKSLVRLVVEDVNEDDSFEVGQKIIRGLSADDLKSIFILSDGLHINGSQLTKGVNTGVSHELVVTGGLAGDGTRFEKTWVLVEGEAVERHVAAVGFYGDRLNVSYGSKGGWKRFGIDRKVTSSRDNVLYTLDNKPALDLYKTYLGEHAIQLPASGLRFPLLLLEENHTEATVRTILAVDEASQSITFAGDIPENSMVSFMKADFDELIDGAEDAAGELLFESYINQPALCIAISCVGRRLVLGQQAEDEIEAVNEIFGPNVSTIGFYSYGEISKLVSGGCDLHNQTMTLTLIWEA